jgi:N-acetylglucosamine malate deacetylase 1
MKFTKEKNMFRVLPFLAAGLLAALSFGFGRSQSNQPKAAGTEPVASTSTTPDNDGKLRIICFGAHPDDCELKAAGVAAMWTSLGHHVKFVSVTNGDIGHWREAGGPLARRRAAEAKAADQMLGVVSEVLDIHDGELEPTLEHRRTLTRLIRRWNADVVLAHRPNDYHPDHRYTGVLVQDSAYMVAVPFFCPEVPRLDKNPVFLFYPDGFKKPNPFQPDLVVSIDPVSQKKLDALDMLESQFYEGGAEGSAALMPSDPAQQAERRRQVRAGHENRDKAIAQRYRNKLVEWYGKEKADQVQHAEAFEICEYGRHPDKKELSQLFPFSD